MTDVRLIVTAKNARLLRAMEECGFETAAALSRASGVSQNDIGKLLALKMAPKRDGEWRRCVLRLSETLRRLPEDLFPPAFVNTPLASNTVSRDIADTDMLALAFRSAPRIGDDPERDEDRRRAAIALNHALAALPPKQAEILRLRFGLTDGRARTLDEIAAQYGVCRQRIRQHEASALQRLKHPGVSKRLRASCAALLEGGP